MDQVVCLTDEELSWLALGRLAEERLEPVNTHLSSCPSCEARLARIEALPDAVIEALRRPGSSISMTKGAAATSRARIEVGQTIDDYEIVERVGAGGMGDVFKARHRRMERLVALKVLSGRGSPQMMNRFSREVLATARLRHPNIALAFDAGDYQGTPYLIMEYLSGLDLAALIKRDGPLPPGKAVDYVIQAARGMEYAHDQGIIHRDIKPANLMVDADGVVKVLDLGLSRLGERADIVGGGGEVGAQEVTTAGTIMGTRNYIAPEQFNDPSSADGRADIYSLGCTLHFLLTGKPMQRNRLRSEEPIPPQLQRAIEKMTATNVADRPASMGAVIGLLEGSSAGRPRRWRWAAAGMVLALAGAGAMYRLRPRLQARIISPAPAAGVLPFDSVQATQLQEQWARYLGLPRAWQDSAGVTLVLVPPGEFQMRPDCRVKITHPYYIGAREIVVSQFRVFADSAGYKTRGELAGAITSHGGGKELIDPKANWRNADWKQHGDEPVTHMAWVDCDAFCTWLSKAEKANYRLPTESEWEWAARAGAAGPYYFASARDLSTRAWYSANSQLRTHAVGMLLPNDWGLYDVIGNVCEYCLDYETDRYPTGVVEDPRGPLSGNLKMIRGSAYKDGPAQSSLNARGNLGPQNALWVAGFRVVREIETKK